MSFEEIEETRLTPLLDALGISSDVLAGQRLPYCPVAQEVIIAEIEAQGRKHLLVPDAARAWQAMKLAAGEDGIVLEMVSGFRTIEDQTAIIREKLERNMPMKTILTLSAPPGYSEHHTGRAVDINTPGCEEREEPFEHTEAFRWLTQHAHRFGFSLSYPRGNALGFSYEPWHWCYQSANTGAAA
jgi:D-alanyl-D-alanine carboxypeptidase